MMMIIFFLNNDGTMAMKGLVRVNRLADLIEWQLMEEGKKIYIYESRGAANGATLSSSSL